MVVTLDAKRRLTVPTALAPATPGHFDAHFDAEEDAIVFRRRLVDEFDARIVEPSSRKSSSAPSQPNRTS